MSAGERDAAGTLARELALALADGSDTPPGTRTVASPSAIAERPWQLLVGADGLALARPDGVRLRLDFAAGRVAARQREGDRAGQPLARAVGVGRLGRRLARPPAVVDATGGLGRDAWFLAALGCRLTVIERSNLVRALLDDALARARASPATADIASRIALVRGDARVRLPELPRPDVVYLDPMYPPARRRAAVRKEMQFLHALLGADTDGAGLLDAALGAARHRVVVKRPSGAPPLAGGAGRAGQREAIRSRGTRYDVYLIAASPAEHGRDASAEPR